MKQRINHILPHRTKGFLGPVFQRVGSRTYANVGYASLGQVVPDPFMSSPISEPDGKSILVQASEEFTGDPTDAWEIDVLGLGTYSAVAAEVDGVPLPRFERDFSSGSLGDDATFTRSTVATYIDSNGVPQQAAINEPRFQDGGYLQEASATNLALGSANFNSAATYWVNTFATGNEVTSIFPGGIAYQALTQAGSGRVRRQTITLAAAKQYVASTWLEVFSAQTIKIVGGIYDSGDWTGSGRWYYQPNNKTTGWITAPDNANASVTFTELGTGPNGGLLLRVDHTFLSTEFSGLTIQVWIQPMGTAADLTGGTTIVHGCQVEVGYKSSSFIITTAAPGVRAADFLSYAKTLPQYFCVLAEVEFLRGLPDKDYSATDDLRLLGTDDTRGTTYEVRTERGVSFGLTEYAGGFVFSIPTTARQSETPYKFAFGIDSNDMFSYENGIEKNRVALTITPDHSNNNVLQVGSWGTAASKSTLFKRIAVYDTGLSPITDAQLEDLTTV